MAVSLEERLVEEDWEVPSVVEEFEEVTSVVVRVGRTCLLR